MIPSATLSIPGAIREVVNPLIAELSQPNA